ncbi:MAG: hypothetical protein KGJ19_03165 [Betaproteobacteria bacterium]|nr:hypothetical protein [Betaproteobacteria bacterium]
MKLEMLKKVRCYFLNETTAAPVAGVVASLTVQTSDSADASQFPVTTLCSDAAGYVSFDLKPVIDSGIMEASALLITAPRVGLDGYDLLSAAQRSEDAPRITTKFGPQISGSSKFEPVCIAFPVYVSPPAIDLDEVCDCAIAPTLPAIQSPDACDRKLSPFSFVRPVTARLGDDCCETLVPSSLPVQEHRFYKVVVRSWGQPVHTIKRRADNVDYSNLSVAEVMVTDTPTTHNPSLKFGEVLEFRHQWFSLGHSLGEIKYSLALAPGESTQVAVIEWARQDWAARTDNVTADENLNHDLRRDRSIEETVIAALRETQEGGSVMGGLAGAATIPIKDINLAFNGAIGGSASHTSGDRNLAADSTQDIHDRVRQQTSYTRSLNSTVVVQATQAEQNRLQTRKVANHNHCHALTVEYYEVLRHYKVRTEFTGRKKAVLVPYAPFAFDDTLAIRFRTILEQTLLDPSLRTGFDAMFRLKYGGTIYEKKAPAGEPAVTRTNTVQVPGKSADGVDSGVTVKKGDTITMSTTDEQIDFGGLAGKNTSSGKPDVASDSFLAPGLKPYSLVYKVGEEGIWQQGGSYQEWTADRDGTVILGTNDEKRWYGDNSGSWTVKVKVTPQETEMEGIGSLRTPSKKGIGSQPKVYDKDEDGLAAEVLLQHLNGNRGYYNQAVWTLENPVDRRLHLEAVLSDYPEILNAIDDKPIAISGNYLAYLFDGEITGWSEKHSDDPEEPLEDIVMLPTRGVFAEAMLGHCNACEKRDVTRMWDWTQMTAETPPDISGVTPGPRGEMPNVTPTQLPGNVIQITQPPAAPDPTGLADALRVMSTPNIFRDLSGLDDVSRLLGQLAQESNDANTKAKANEAKSKVDSIKASSAAGASGSVDAKGPSSSGEGRTYEPDAAKQYDKGTVLTDFQKRGLLTSGQANRTASAIVNDAPSPAGGGGSARDVLGTVRQMLLGATPPPTPVEKLIGNGDVLVRGIDVSHYQKNIDWAKVRTQVSFAFIKATDGTSEDAYFQANWKNSQANGMIVGAYHYFRAGVPGDRQADAFMKAVGTRRLPQLPPAIDIEWDKKSGDNDLAKLHVTQAEFVRQLHAFCDAIEGFYGIKPIIYTNASLWADLTGDCDEFADHPLWVTNVASNTSQDPILYPWIPPAWRQSWYFWQYSWAGQIDGIVGNVDLNFFNGDTMAFISGFTIIK